MRVEDNFRGFGGNDSFDRAVAGDFDGDNVGEHIILHVGVVGVNSATAVGGQGIVTLSLDISEKDLLGIVFEGIFGLVYKGGHNIEAEEQVCGSDDDGENKAGVNQCEDGNTACLAGVELVVVGEPAVNEGGGEKRGHRQDKGEGNREEINHKSDDLSRADAEFLDRAQNAA